MPGRQGVFTAVFRNPKKDERFQHNSHDVSELAFSDSFVGSRLFASVFGFCQCNDTPDHSFELWAVWMLERWSRLSNPARTAPVSRPMAVAAG